MTEAAAAPLRERKSHLWARHPDDYYVEPRWCSDRLFQVERFCGPVWDPACGLGNIVAAASSAGLDIHGTDIVARTNACVAELDFLDMIPATWWDSRSIVCNPPFKHAEAFVKLALVRAQFKVAMLLPAAWLQGDKRSRWLETTPLFRVWFLSPRPSMPPGPVIEAGLKSGNGTTDYAWFVWMHGYDAAPMVRWLRKDP